MSDPIRKVSTGRLIKHLNLRADVGKEIVRRLVTSNSRIRILEDQIDMAETKICDLEDGIQRSMNQLREMI